MSKALEAAASACHAEMLDHLFSLKAAGHEENGFWTTAGMSDAELLCRYCGIPRERHDVIFLHARMNDAATVLAAELAEKIIRAFAESITDEMVDAFFEAKLPHLTGEIATTRAREGIRAAILKGLE